MKVLLTLALAASSVFAVAAAAPGRAVSAPQGVAYAGQTSQDLPVSFVLSRDRRTIRRLDVEWYAEADQCTSAITYMSGTTFGARKTKALRLTSRRTFRHTYVDSLTVPGVARVEEDAVVRGTVGRTRASGAFRVTAVVTDAAGAVINRCETGTITWRAVE
ncbi:MAG TPA: hypothetical protein VGV90_13535 [Solirubrobacteraceae bacterium]|nr:hypothetical protein [Solirubrobacteraceae bacterium]